MNTGSPAKQTQSLNLRVSPELKAKLEAKAREMSDKFGVAVPVSQVVIQILTKALK